MFCSEAVEELRKASKADSLYPPVLFFFPAGREKGIEFFGNLWPEARAVSDENGQFYRHLEVSRASLRELFGPGVWLKAVKAIRSGYIPGRTVGNPWLMPAVLFVRESRILWEWTFRNIGDNPDFASLTMRLEEARRLAAD